MRADEGRTKPRIREVIICEGRDDTAAILRAADCLTIETHGYGMSRETWERIARVYQDPGIVIFTDPDHAGREIRRTIKARFPDAKTANLTIGQAEKKGDIGIENAEPEDILRALARVCTLEYPDLGADDAGPCGGGQTADGEASRKSCAASQEDLEELGLMGGAGSREARMRAGAALGIGYGNGKAMAKRIAALGITREELEKALKG